MVKISGLAIGCDSLAHKGCLDVNGKIVAIVGTGLDIVYPKENKELLERILSQGGLVISEYPIGFKGTSYSFVERDRLQASCYDIVVTIQTSIKGGSMHASKDCVNKYRNKFYVVDPLLIDDGDTTGNSYLIEELGGEEINSISNLNNIFD